MAPADAFAAALPGDGDGPIDGSPDSATVPAPGIKECTSPKECALAKVYDELSLKCSIDFESYAKSDHFLDDFLLPDHGVGGITTSCCDGVSIWVQTEASTYGNIDPDEPDIPGLPSCPDSTLFTLWAKRAAFDCSAPFAKKLNTLWVKLYEPDTGLIGERAFLFWTTWTSTVKCTTKENWNPKCCPNPKPEK